MKSQEFLTNQGIKPPAPVLGLGSGLSGVLAAANSSTSLSHTLITEEENVERSERLINRIDQLLPQMETMVQKSQQRDDENKRLVHRVGDLKKSVDEGIQFTKQAIRNLSTPNFRHATVSAINTLGGQVEDLDQSMRDGVRNLEGKFRNLTGVRSVLRTPTLETLQCSCDWLLEYMRCSIDMIKTIPDVQVFEVRAPRPPLRLPPLDMERMRRRQV